MALIKSNPLFQQKKVPVRINDPAPRAIIPRSAKRPETPKPTGEPEMDQPLYAGGTPGFYEGTAPKRVKVPYTRRSQLIEERRPNVQDLLPEVQQATRTASNQAVPVPLDKPRETGPSPQPQQSLIPLMLIVGSALLLGG